MTSTAKPSARKPFCRARANRTSSSTTSTRIALRTPPMLSGCSQHAWPSMDVSGAGWCGDSNYARMMIMGLTTSHPAIRWAVPGAVVAIVLAAAGLTAVTADASPTLPPRSAAELLVDVQTASVATLSGTVVQTAELGLPDLPVQMG